MIKVMGRSISIIAGILACCSGLAAEPFSVVDSFRKHVRTVSSFTASIERIQSFRQVARASSGILNYDKRYGSLYDWKTPGNYRFFRSDFGAYGADLKKKKGWKTEFGTPDPDFSHKIDPLYRLLQLASLPTDQLTYRGNSGDLLIFSTDIGKGKKRFLGFESRTARCRLVEIADSKGAVTEKTKFYYPVNDTETPLPESIVVTGLVGSELSVDSVAIKDVHINKKLKRAHFSVPPKITWQKRISAVLPE